MRIIVLVPAMSQSSSFFMFDLANLMMVTASSLPEDWDLGIAMTVGTYIHQSRQELLENALADGADYVLWVDSDMRFPADGIIKLLQHSENVVGINYSQRTSEAPDFVAIKHVPEKEGDLGVKLVTTEGSTGLEEVDAMGFGFVLINVGGLKGLPDPQRTPWFWYEQRWPGDHVGEDVYFYRMLRNSCGQKIYVDHDLSKECGHVGDFTFRTAHVAKRHEMLKEEMS